MRLMVIFAVEIEGYTKMVFQDIRHAQAYARSHNEFQKERILMEPERIVVTEAAVHAWQVMENAHKFHPEDG